MGRFLQHALLLSEVGIYHKEIRFVCGQIATNLATCTFPLKGRLHFLFCATTCLPSERATEVFLVIH